jgi:hypothetical protein
MDKSDEDEYAALQIFKQLNVICERFKQSKVLVENARQHLSAQKNFTATQCKRAIKSFFELNDAIEKLHNLLKQWPLPEIIDSQRHSISLKLRMLEQCRDELPNRINALSNRFGRREEIRSRQEDFIASIQILIEQLDELISVLDSILTSAMLSAPVSKQDMEEAGSGNNEQEPLRLTNMPLQFSERPTAQNSYSWSQFVLSLIGGMLNILIGLFAPKTTHAIPPSAIPETTQIDVPDAMPEIIDGNPVSGIIVPIGAAEVRDEGSFEFLYNLLLQYVEPEELEPICRKIHINYQSLDDKSHETRAYSLAKKMENRGCLDELEQELRERLPRRFSNFQQP